MTFLSIIIPFNKPKRYLKDCLESIRLENLNDFEVILILNGVVEDLTDLLEDYKDDLNLVIKEFPNEMTVGKARNIGLDISNGDYIYFIDSDDYLYDNALTKLVNAAQKTNADFINGERIKTPFIRERFEEELESRNYNFLKADKDSLNFSIKLLVGDKTDSYDLMSALHSLIKKDKIGDVRFGETERYFADYYFMLDVLDNLESFEGIENAIYAKRTSDDSVNFPSLNQEIEENDFSLFLKQYFKVKDIVGSKSKKQFKILNNALIRRMQNFYYHKFSEEYINNRDDIWRKDYINEVSQIAKDFNPENFSWKNKLEIKALQQKDFGKYSKLVNFRFAYVNFKLMLKEHWRFKRAIYKNYLNKKDTKKNKILFESFYGRYYSDSPKYIYEYILENHRDKFDIVWVLDDSSVHIPGNPKKVKKFSLGYYKHLAQSEYYLFNTRHPARIIKKDDQKFICTWHGTPLKRLGYDIENLYINNPNVKHGYRRDSLQWDYMVSPNKYTTDILRSAFAYEGEIIESGYPRNDPLYNADESKIARIKEDLNIPKDKKVILYAPTWRDDEQIEATIVNFTLKLDLEKFKKSLSDEYVILLRMHYFVANHLNLDGFEDFVFDVSDYEDISELYLASDMLITDYSSVFFDYANLKRPILFFDYDLDKYENVLRGFYIDIHTEVPGPILKTNDELLDAIINIDQIEEDFSQRYDEFYERFCSIDDGNASKRIYERVWK